MKAAQNSDSPPVKSRYRKNSLSPWDYEPATSFSPMKFQRERSFTENAQENKHSFLYPVINEPSPSVGTQRPRTFLTRTIRAPKKSEERRNRKIEPVASPLSQRNPPKRLKIKQARHNISTMESEGGIESKQWLALPTRNRSLPVSRQDIRFEIADSKLDAKVVLINVDKYLADYKKRGNLNQIFFENYYGGQNERMRRSQAKDAGTPTNAQPKFSRRDWKNRRNMQFYII